MLSRFRKRRPEARFEHGPASIIAQFIVYKEDYAVDRKRKIFLSHKGADKPIVRRYYKLLKTLGFDPWLDEEDMPAGTQLHRGILAGFDVSCTLDLLHHAKLQDERFLRTEVNYAKDQQTKKEINSEL